ncbi:MAG: DUF3300 domain-containing protein [Azospirillum sp.]|nr:DUF3300 domain-containing protein [Azospirillum sp.]
MKKPDTKVGLVCLAILLGGAVVGSSCQAQTAPPPVAPVAGPGVAAPEQRKLTDQELDQLCAPVALYPDALLAQVLVASTYPLEVVQAARWLADNKSVKPADLQPALAEKTWDPSVKALTGFPSVLAIMNDKLEWTTLLGDTVLARQADVMASIQRLRAQAQAAGHLTSTKEQTVVVKEETIIIKPADPQVVYVPQYNTQTVYVPATTTTVVAAPPPATYSTLPPTPTYSTSDSSDAAAAGVLGFGVGMLTGYLIAEDDGFDWDEGDIYAYRGPPPAYGAAYGYPGYGGAYGYPPRTGANVSGNTVSGNSVTVNQTNTVNQANVDRQAWQHDPAHRQGVAYSDPAVSQRYQQGGSRPADGGPEARGYSGTAGARPSASSLQNSLAGGANASALGGSARGRQATGDAARGRDSQQRSNRSNSGNSARRSGDGAGAAKPADGGSRRQAGQSQTGRGQAGQAQTERSQAGQGQSGQGQAGQGQAGQGQAGQGQGQAGQRSQRSGSTGSGRFQGLRGGEGKTPSAFEGVGAGSADQAAGGRGRASRSGGQSGGRARRE